MKPLLLNIKSLDTIPYANKLLRRGGEINYLTPEEFKQKFGCEYADNLWISDQVSQSCTPIDVPAELAKLKIEYHDNPHPEVSLKIKTLEHLLNPFRDFAICFIDEEVGHGLFATNYVPVNTVVAVYTGLVSEVGMSDYALQSSHLCVDASKKGGIARFMQHAPFNLEKDLAIMHTKYTEVTCELERSKANAKITEQQINKISSKINEIKTRYEADVANLKSQDGYAEYNDIIFANSIIARNTTTATVKRIDFIIGNISITAFVTQYHLVYGDAFTFPYGTIRYWLRPKTDTIPHAEKSFTADMGLQLQDIKLPHLFWHDGSVLNTSLYRRKCLTLSQTADSLADKWDVISTIDEQNDCDDVPAYCMNDFLAGSNLLFGEKLAKQENNSFVLALQVHLPAVKFACYYSFPSFLNNEDFYSAKIRENYKNKIGILDCVCSMPDAETYQLVIAFLNPIKGRLKLLPLMNQIIIKSINVDTKDLHAFILQLPRSQEPNQQVKKAP